MPGAQSWRNYKHLLPPIKRGKVSERQLGKYNEREREIIRRSVELAGKPLLLQKAVKASGLTSAKFWGAVGALAGTQVESAQKQFKNTEANLNKGMNIYAASKGMPVEKVGKLQALTETAKNYDFHVPLTVQTAKNAGFGFAAVASLVLAVKAVNRLRGRKYKQALEKAVKQAP